MTTSQGKDKVRRPRIGRLKTMLIFYLTIPFMVLGTAIAILPLIVAMKHQHKWEESPTQPVVRGAHRDDEPLAA